MIDTLLSRLKGVRRNGSNGWLALCPGHDDHEPSLSITEVDGKILLNCFAGCELREILKPLHLEPKDLFIDGNGGRGSVTNGQRCEHVNSAQKHSQKELTGGLLTVVNGVTINTLAEAKRLPLDFLKSLGISDYKYNDQPSVKIPYYSEDGTETAVRFRLSLTAEAGERFKWRKGDRAMPYGLNRLGQIKKTGWVLIVEGESDCWTCWFHGIPALGAPGKSIFPEAWGGYLEGIGVYLWQEPGAEDFIFRVSKAVPNLKVITAPDGMKDISEAHIQGLDVASLLGELKTTAKPAELLKAHIINARLSELHQQARPVIEADDPLELIQKAIKGLGFGGDIRPPLITYLSATSRLLAMREGAMLVHLLLTGLTSAGKTYTLGIIKRLLPPDTYHEIKAGSPRVLIYDDAELQHKLLIFGEADSLPAGEDNPAASAIRNLLQDHYLHYMVTIKDKDTGDYTVRKVEKAGPTVLITTSTKPLGEQLNSRFFTLECSDSAEQISAALTTQAGLEIADNTLPDNALVAYQSYLQLKAPWRVVVPFAPELADAMGKMAVAPRILRDFARLLSLIKVVTILRHHKRHLDSEGRLVAELADYETVRELVAEMYIESTSGAAADIRELVEAVKELDASRADGKQITNTTIARHLNIGIMQATRRAKKARRYGWLVNREQRKGYPADYALGEPMPETEGLPLLKVDIVDIVDKEGVNDFSFKNGTVNMLTPLTDGDTPPYTPDMLNEAKKEVMVEGFGNLDYDTVLDMTVEAALKLWRSEGAPWIYIAPGENCTDLDKLLSQPDVKPYQLQAVKEWLDKRKHPTHSTTPRLS